MIEAQDIDHWYKTGHWLFRHVSVAFRPGTISAILGVNGSGKTTFLRTLCGALRPREGHISLDGVIGYVPQAQLADCAFRAVDMVLLGRSRYLGRFSSPRSSDILRALECLDEVGMSGVAEQNYDQLSGGQRQLVLLTHAPDHALSIARDALLFLDDAKHIFGPVAATMTDENLSQLYRVPMRRVSLTTVSGRVESVLPFHRLNDP
jgi:iron complex transport system ATP-binding protein